MYLIYYKWCCTYVNLAQILCLYATISRSVLFVYTEVQWSVFVDGSVSGGAP